MASKSVTRNNNSIKSKSNIKPFGKYSDKQKPGSIPVLIGTIMIFDYNIHMIEHIMHTALTELILKGKNNNMVHKESFALLLEVVTVEFYHIMIGHYDQTSQWQILSYLLQGVVSH